MNLRALATVALIVSLYVLVNVLSHPFLVSAYQTPLTPDQIRAAYDVTPLLQSGYTGKGVTVAIVLAQLTINATFYSDLKAFNSKYGLPDAVISVAQPYEGSPQTAEEITADTEFVHAMAPDAKILLVPDFSYVIDHNAADIATTSWTSGADRNTILSDNTEYAKSVGMKITLIAASGDGGSNNTFYWPNGVQPPDDSMAQYSQYLTVVGGTALTLQAGTYSETGWENSGGGPSNLFTQPTWQKGRGVPENGFRNIPDIALNAACETPYADYYEGKPSGFCGTSGAAPIFAGIMADIMQAAGERLGFLNPTLYSLSSSDPSVYHDVTSGCSLLQAGSSKQTGYCAHAGWNFVTGFGSIDATKLATHLAPGTHIVPATTTTTSREPPTETTASISPFTQHYMVLGQIETVIVIAFIVVLVIVLVMMRRRLHSEY